jgi:hypothetical protein
LGTELATGGFGMGAATEWIWARGGEIIPRVSKTFVGKEKCSRKTWEF